MIVLHLSNGVYRFSDIAFAKRLLNIINSRGWTTLAQAQAGFSAVPFSAAGWTQLKKMLGELYLGSVTFPGEHVRPNGLDATLTDSEVADRNVMGGIT